MSPADYLGMKGLLDQLFAQLSKSLCECCISREFCTLFIVESAVGNVGTCD
jgi:hypothetical protein